MDIQDEAEERGLTLRIENDMMAMERDGVPPASILCGIANAMSKALIRYAAPEVTAEYFEREARRARAIIAAAST